MKYGTFISNYIRLFEYVMMNFCVLYKIFFFIIFYLNELLIVELKERLNYI